MKQSCDWHLLLFHLIFSIKIHAKLFQTVHELRLHALKKTSIKGCLLTFISLHQKVFASKSFKQPCHGMKQEIKSENTMLKVSNTMFKILCKDTITEVRLYCLWTKCVMQSKRKFFLKNYQGNYKRQYGSNCVVLWSKYLFRSKAKVSTLFFNQNSSKRKTCWTRTNQISSFVKKIIKTFMKGQ